MKYAMRGRYATAIDIGTTKICVLIAQIDARGGVEVIGVGHHPSFGLKKGVVVNIGKTVKSIKAALHDAQTMAGVHVETATVGISGGHIRSFNSTGIVAIRGRDVTQYDIDRVIDQAKAIPIPEGQEILHVLPQYFRVDNQEYVVDSLGMYGLRLEAQVHIITGAVSSAQNIIKSCELAGIRMPDIVLEQLASAEAVLTESESLVGAGIIDIGGGTCDFAIYKDGRIRHSKVLPVAGNHFTNDLAISLGIPLDQAEELKKRYGSTDYSFLKNCPEKNVPVSMGYEGVFKSVDLEVLSDVLRARAEEIFELFGDEINEYRLKHFMPSGLVLTGGGSLLAGIQGIAQEKLGVPVRVGYPISRTEEHKKMMPDLLKSPIYSTAYGLVLYATGQINTEHISNVNEPVFVRVFKRMKSWIHDFL